MTQIIYKQLISIGIGNNLKQNATLSYCIVPGKTPKKDVTLPYAAAVTASPPPLSYFMEAKRCNGNKYSPGIKLLIQ